MYVVCCYILSVFSRLCAFDRKVVWALQRYEYIAILAKVMPHGRFVVGLTQSRDA